MIVSYMLVTQLIPGASNATSFPGPTPATGADEFRVCGPDLRDKFIPTRLSEAYELKGRTGP